MLKIKIKNKRKKKKFYWAVKEKNKPSLFVERNMCKYTPIYIDFIYVINFSLL